MRSSKRRQYGTGSIFWNAALARWIGTIEAGTTPKGTRRRITVSSSTPGDEGKAQCRRKLDQKVRQIYREGAPATAAGATTVKAWADQWLAVRVRTQRPKSFATDRSAVAKWIEPAPRGRWLYPSALSPAERCVAEVEQEAVWQAGAQLRFGLARSPKVWMFVDAWDPPAVCTISTRPYRRGEDAAAAIAGMGVMPAAVWATRLLLMWDHWDLETSLHGEGDYPRGLVAVQVTYSGNLLHWYPYTLTVDLPAGPEPLGPVDVIRGIGITWGQPAAHVDAVLPGPIEQLLQRWRQADGPDPAIVIPGLQAAGYVFTSFTDE